MKKLILMTMATLATTAVSAQGLQYPKAEKDGTVDEYFGNISHDGSLGSGTAIS